VVVQLLLMASLPGAITVSLGRNDLAALTLSTAAGAQATVYLQGAHVTSWRAADGEERLFLSSASAFEPCSPIRGGVPVCWPQFSSRGPLAKHGFARTSEWVLESMASTADSAEVVLRLFDSEATRAAWPFAFSLLYTVILTDASLSMRLEATNTGAKELQFTGALHTYLAVPSVQSVRVAGLGGLTYEDNTAGLALVQEPAADSLSIVGEVDRVYLNAPPSLTLTYGQPSPTHNPPAALRVEQKGFREAVLWNIGQERAAGLTDLGAGEWSRYVCLEAAAAALVSIPPGATFIGSQTLTVG
jgi:glucose-6-phosphate 1-epimerase